jgi:hypothetical protein
MSYERVQFWLWIKACAIVGVILLLCTLGGCATVDAPARESKPCAEWPNGYCTYQGPEQWTRADTRREVAYQIVNALDAIQTSMIRDRPDLVEGMPLTRAVLGAKPDLGDTALYFASMGVSHFIIARLLPPKWRAWYQSGTLAFSSYTVGRNCIEHGLGC